MIIQRLANGSASTIQITTTATLLTALLDTAAGVANNLPNGLDAVDIVIEGADVRMLEDGNIPTATTGELLKGNGSIHRLRGVALHQMYLISTTGSSSQASVQVGLAQSGDEESSDAINPAASTGGGIGTTGTPNVSQIVDGTTTTQKAAVDASGNVSVKLGVNPTVNAGTGFLGNTTTPTVSQLADGTTPTNLAAVDTAGADAVSNTKNALATQTRISGFNGTTWDRIRAGITGVVSSVTGFLNVSVFGTYNSTTPSLTNGQSNPIQQDSRGLLRVALNVPNDGTQIKTLSDNQDAVAVSGTGDKYAVVNRSTIFNGSSWDREYGNEDVTLLSSAARTTTQTSADQVNYNNRAINVVVDVTSAGTGSITCAINYKDPASGKYIPLLTGAAITTNSTNMYTVCPGIAAVTNVSANAVVPRTFQVVITANNANSVTYSVGYSLTR